MPVSLQSIALAFVALAAPGGFNESLPKEYKARDGSIMVLVSSGEFTMGSLDGEKDEFPLRRINLPSFYMDKHEVTHKQYAQFLQAAGRKAPVDWPDGKMPPKLAEFPVVNVSFAYASA
jgi:formylglycine-generating enzyme required for sulfatase activity